MTLHNDNRQNTQKKSNYNLTLNFDKSHSAVILPREMPSVIPINVILWNAVALFDFEAIKCQLSVSSEIVLKVKQNFTKFTKLVITGKH